MSVIESSIPAVLAERAQQQPDDIAFTFIDYEVDPAGFAERLTWSHVYRRARVVAAELSLCGSVGDRAAILAPHGLDYIVAFLGAIQAGFIAVPLPVPQFGTLDERVSGALRDSSPVAILTTSAVVDGADRERMFDDRHQPSRGAAAEFEDGTEPTHRHRVAFARLDHGEDCVLTCRHLGSFHRSGGR
jgi:acyl-CoA synthetase (AMP-forming)/AMP-acid ligase II